MTTGVQISQNVVVSVRSNLPQKSSTVLSEPKFGPPQSNVPGSTPEQGVTSQTEISQRVRDLHRVGEGSCRGWGLHEKTPYFLEDLNSAIEQ